MGIGKTVGTVAGIGAGVATVGAGAPVIVSAVGAGAVGLGISELTMVSGSYAAVGATTTIGSALTSLNAFVVGLVPQLAGAGTALTGLIAGNGALTGFLTGMSVTVGAAPIVGAVMLTVGVVAAGFLVKNIVQSIGKSAERKVNDVKQDIQIENANERQEQLAQRRQQLRDNAIKREQQIAENRIKAEQQKEKHYDTLASNYENLSDQKQRAQQAAENAEYLKHKALSTPASPPPSRDRADTQTFSENELERRQKAAEFMSHVPII